MVGVGGRSKACATCRKRRVKCDEAKPTCQRCAKAKVVCGGYRGLAVIQYDGRSQKAKPSRTPSPNILKLEDDVVELPHQAVIQINRSDPPDQVSEIISYFSFGVRICTPVDEIYVSYTMTHLLRGADDAAQLSGVERQLSDKCFMALATTYFGTQHREKSISEYGFQRYGTALKDVNRALGDEKRVVGFDMMESVVIMALYEFLISNSENGWIGHSQGLERLLELHGPDSFSLSILMLFEKSRTSIIFAALATHTPTILSKPEWKTSPWSAFPNHKDDVQFLLDVLADCPQLLVTKDILATTTNPEDRVIGYQAFLQNTLDLLDQLEQWRQRWISRHPDFAVEVAAPDSTPHFFTPENKRIPLWPTIFQYKSYQQANIYALYNATLIFLLRQIEETIYSTPGLASLPIVETCPSKLYTAGIEICRSVDYHLDGMRDGMGSFGILYPLRMAYDAVGRHDVLVGEWLKGVLKRIKESTGTWAIAGYLLNINPPQEATPSCHS